MLKIELQGLERQLQRFKDLPKQVRYAASRALNDVGTSAAGGVSEAMPRVFDRPTQFVMNSIDFKRATRDQLSISIGPKRKGSGGVNPASVLRAEVLSGGRRLKRSEIAFQRAGVLPAGMYMAPSFDLLASDKVDANGNIKGSFIVQLLSYFQAFGEKGFRANMKAKGRDRLKRSTRRQLYGVEYFVSLGDASARGGRGAAVQKPGIYARRVTGFGEAIYPIFHFVRSPKYSARLDMATVVRTAVQRDLPNAMSKRLAEALATAR